VITNADAGTATEEALEKGLEVLQAHLSVDVQSTGNPGELDSVLHRCGSRRIVVAGGDGSLHAVIAALHKRNDLSGATIGLLPLGTGNDFARAMDIPLDPEDAAQVIVDGFVRPVDLLVDELGDVVVGAGAQASRRGARWKERLGKVGVGKVNLGRLGYPIGALQSTLQPPHVRLRVEVDGKVVCDLDEKVLMVSLGNGSSVGGGAELNPDADPHDHCIDVVISRSVSVLAKLGYVAALARRAHQRRDDVDHLSGSTVSISGESFYCAADGEISGPERQRTWHIEPAAYSMVLPNG
jgi:diacylglycerol kinase (ATP)